MIVGTDEFLAEISELVDDFLHHRIEPQSDDFQMSIQEAFDGFVLVAARRLSEAEAEVRPWSDVSALMMGCFKTKRRTIRDLLKRLLNWPDNLVQEHIASCVGVLAVIEFRSHCWDSFLTSCSRRLLGLLPPLS
jgi:hypothetical protein